MAAILARQPSPAAPPKGPAPQEDRAATMTAGLGEDLGVIPIDSYAWAEGHPGPAAGANGDSPLHEVTIQFGPNPVAAQIAHAAANGKFIGKAFVSTQKVTFDLVDTVLMNFKQSGEGSHGEVTSVTLNFTSLEIRRPS